MNNKSIEFKPGDIVAYKGIGVNMIIVEINREERMSKPFIKSIRLRYWDSFLQEFKDQMINDVALIELVSE